MPWVLALMLLAAPPPDLAGLPLGTLRPTALASSTVASLCASTPTCQGTGTGSRCACAGSSPGGAIEVELDFAGAGEAGELALIAVHGPSLGWAQQLAGSGAGLSAPRPLRCPDLAGVEAGHPGIGLLRVGDRAGRGYVELRDPTRLPRAWGQHLEVHPTAFPEVAATPAELATDWIGLELAGRFNVPLVPAARSQVLADQGPPFDGLALRAIQRTDHALFAYGFDYGSEWVDRAGGQRATRVGALGEADLVLLSPARRLRPLLGVGVQLDWFGLAPPSQSWVVPAVAPRIGATLAVNDALLGRVALGYAWAPRPPGSAVQPGGAFVELAIGFGLGTEASALETPAQLDAARSGAALRRGDEQLASMQGFWRPAGQLEPAADVIEVDLPVGAFRLHPSAGVTLPRARTGRLEDYGDSLRAGDSSGATEVFVRRAGPVRFTVIMGCQAVPRPIAVEQLDVAGWQAAHPELAQGAAP